MRLFSYNFFVIIPEIFFSISLIFLVILGIFLEKLVGNFCKVILPTFFKNSVLLLVLTIFLLVNQEKNFFGSVFYFNIYVSELTQFFKIFICIFCILFFFMVFFMLEKDKFYGYEFYLFVLFSLLGYFFLISSYNFLILYLSIELSSFCLYVLASFKFFNLLSIEGGLKYFILGSFSSGILLLGISIIYGCTGMINFSDLLLFSLSSSGQSHEFGILFGVILVLFGLFFKLAVVPFHFWISDIYDGSSLIVTAFFAILSKIGVFVLFFRFVYDVFYPFFDYFVSFFLICGCFSILLGTFGALVQYRLKRFMAYSGIVHVGYLLLGLSTGTRFGVFSSFLYLIVYVLLTFNFFSILFVCVKNSGKELSKLKTVNDLSVLLRTDMFSSINLSLNLFSFSGIPPLAGFFTKFYILLSLVYSGFYFSAFFIVVVSVVSSVYYLRLIKIMYFEKPFKWSFFLQSNFLLSFVSISSFYFNCFFIFFQNIFVVLIFNLF